MKIVVKLPTRRQKIAAQTIDKYLYFASGKHDLRVIVSIDADDTPAWSRYAEEERVSIHVNPLPQTKITAMNANLEGVEFDVLIAASDDMIPVASGYDDVIAKDMICYFPKLDGLLHYPDGRQNENLCTCPVIGKGYYDRFGYVYDPAFFSLFADNLVQDTAQAINKYRFVNKMILKHPWTDLTGFDKLHARNSNSSVFMLDQQTYQTRKAAGFPKA